MSLPKWTTKDGKKLSPSEIGDTHLVNIIRQLHRRAEIMKQSELEAAMVCESMLQGEMALMAIESDILKISEWDIEELLDNRLPIYKYLIKEVEKRKLKV